MSLISGHRGTGAKEYDIETEEWEELASKFINNKIYLPLLELLIETKKQIYRHVMTQKNHRQFIKLAPIIKKINRKITLIFHYFADIEKNASQLFCSVDIENIDKAIEFYEKFSKKISLEWPICISTDILKTLPKLKADLQKFKKHLLSTFYLLTKFFQGKSPNKKNLKLF